MNLILKAHTLSQCMEIMAEYVAAHEALGEKNLIFCEDRLTLLAERALLKNMGGSFYSTVCTFARFLKSDERTISKQGSVMAVGDVMTKLQEEKALQCFTNTTSIGNNAKCIYETLAQLSASEVTPEDLKNSLASLPDDMLRKKIHDLALIYEGYKTFLEENKFLDESKYLALLPSYLGNYPDMKNTNVFFLGFNSFTAQARSAIRAASKSAKNVVGIFCAGEAELYTNEATTAFEDAFGKGVAVQIRALGKPLFGEAEVLRQGLFDPEKMVGPKMATERIHMFEAEDKTAEAEYVATQIRKAMCEEASLRFRDVSVLTSDVAGYSLSLKKAFDEYNIPYFIDEKKSLKHHPLSRFLLDCFKVVREGFSPLATQSLTQNFFFGESDEYRNYLLKYANYRGGAKRAIKTNDVVLESFDLEVLEQGRERLLLATKGIKSEDSGRNYCNAVRKILEDFDAEKRLEELGENLDISQQGYLSQIYRALERVLAEAELLTATQKMSVAQFEAILSDGLDATEISLIPLKVDAVFIGDITDSRIEQTKILFAVGMTDAVPRTGSDTAIVSDKEIKRLADIKPRLEPTVAQVNLRSRESACLNLCAFTQALHLSYALAADGSEPSVSEVFHYINKLFSSAEKNEKGEYKALSKEKQIKDADFKYKCSAPIPALRQFLIEKKKYKEGEEDALKEYSSLFEALDKFGVQEKEDFFRERTGHVRVECGETLFLKDGKIYPTALETYFSCPFKHFVDKGLHLKEREETAVLAMDTGNFIHDLLQASAKKLKADKTDKDIAEDEKIKTDEDMRKFAMKKGAEMLCKSVYAVQQDTESGSYFTEKLLAEGVEATVAMYHQLVNSKFAVKDTEKKISADFFGGKPDRVDLAEVEDDGNKKKYLRIIDYKTGNIQASALSYYIGQKLQLQLYMSAFKGEEIPAGVFYFPASLTYSNEGEEKFQMQGFLNGDREALLCGDENLTETTKSAYFPAALKNPPQATSIMDEGTFRDFLDYSVFVARKAYQEIQGGFIAPSPYETSSNSSCKYCKYGGMCGYMRDTATARAESTITPKEIATIAREEREGRKE